MTSGSFKSVPITSIIIERESRQRRALKTESINELAESIHRIGLINPPVVTVDHVLIAGECRVTACRNLGWTSIPVQYVEELSEYELKCIELEENVKREDLSWQDECLAVYELHKLYSANNENWSQQKTADAIGFVQPHVVRNIEVAKELVAGNEAVVKADKFSVAHNMVRRNNERKKASAIDSVSQSVAALVQDEEAEVATPPAPTIPLLLTDFHEWQEAYDGQRFNLIHCDFPYGINVGTGPRQNSSIKDFYDDSPDVYWSLLDRLHAAMDNVVAESAHLIFWFSMEYYCRTFEALSSMGWNVAPHVLVWHKSDNAGTAPDPQRLPRRTYETAFFATRGDRKLTEAGTRSNSIAHPGKRPDGAHMSEKPKEVLRHFFSMICDEYSVMLDPTCGGANAVKVAEELGASTVLGLEKEEEFYELASRHWEA